MTVRDLWLLTDKPPLTGDAEWRFGSGDDGDLPGEYYVAILSRSENLRFAYGLTLRWDSDGPDVPTSLWGTVREKLTEAMQITKARWDSTDRAKVAVKA